jgi:hypothetical protein
MREGVTLDEDFLPLPARKGSRLDAILIADAARERVRALRAGLVALVAVLGLPLWIVVAWPGRFSSDVRVTAATAWILGALGVLAALGREWWWARIRSRRVADLGPLPVLRSPRRASEACAAPSEEED